MFRRISTNNMFRVVKKRVVFFIIVFQGLSSAFPALGQKVVIDENISYFFNVSTDLHLSHNIYLKPDSISLLLEINYNNGKIFDNYDYIVEFHKSYHVLEVLRKDTINIREHIIAIRAGKIFVKLKLPRLQKADLLLIRCYDRRTGVDYIYDIPLIQEYNFSTDGLSFYSQDGITPILDDFLSTGETLMIKCEDGNVPVHGFYYKHPFDEALPPMVVEDSRAGRDLIIDSVFTIQAGDIFTLTGKGLYFFQRDSTSGNGIAIRIEDEFFPLVKTIDELLNPVIYISTRAETDKIRSDPDPKQAFEQYWINLVKIPNLATSTVRLFYERVEAANYLFTTFKEGWKTDMGLIYIIYGPPNDVYKSEEIIDWVYNQDLTIPTVRFSFYKVKNVFTDQHYTLLRKKDYDRIWFRSVENWRKGKK